MDTFSKILNDSYRRVLRRGNKSFVSDASIRQRVETVVLCLRNRAGVRALLAGLLAKIQSPAVDIRKPYTDIAGATGGDCYSGRFYDERYVQRLADSPYRFPINATTAFLTPGFRTKNIVLTMDINLEGRPAEMYKALLELFDSIQNNRVTATTVMDESMRLLVIERDQRQASIEKLVRDINRTADQLPLWACDSFCKSGVISKKTPLFALQSTFFVIFMPHKLQIPHYFFDFKRFLARERLPPNLSGCRNCHRPWRKCRELSDYFSQHDLI